VPTHKSPIRFTHHTLDIRKSTHEKGQKCQQFVEEREKERGETQEAHGIENRRRDHFRDSLKTSLKRKRINYARHQNGIPTYKHADRRRYNSLAASAFLRISEQTAPFLSKEISPGSRMTENIIRKTVISLRYRCFDSPRENRSTLRRYISTREYRAAICSLEIESVK